MLTPKKASQRLVNQPLGQLHAHDRLLVLLKSGGPQTTAALAGRLGITGEAARQQLVRLEEEGLLEASSESHGRGRPHQVWKLTAAANRRFPDSHPQLTAQLIQIIQKTLGERALDQVLDAREQELLDSYKIELKDAPNLKERVERLVKLRSAEGYMAECQPEKDSYLLIENHCPICDAAGVCLKFCRSEKELFGRLLGPRVSVNREEFMVSGSRRCVYRIRPKPANAASSRARAASR